MRKRWSTPSWRTVCVMAAGVLGVAIATSLGFWQLDRAQQKMDWQARMQAQQQAQPLHNDELQQLLQSPTSAQQWHAQLHRRVQLQGHWLAEHTLYLDNRQMHGRPGFFVLTPLQLPNGGVVLVQRGWIARNFQDRNQLQPVDTPSALVEIHGYVSGPPARLLAMGEETLSSVTTDNPIRQNVDLSALAQSTGWLLAPGTVVQMGAASDGLQRDWHQPDSGVATHHGYAFQWFAIATVLAGMLVWFHVLRPARVKRNLHHDSP